MRKSLISLICASSALALLLGGCGSVGSDTSDGSPSHATSPSNGGSSSSQTPSPSSGGSSSSQTPSPSNSSGADNSSSGGAASFKNGVLTTRDVNVRITRYKVIEAGQKGNEHGDKPVIAFWYQTTNRSGALVDPTLAWIMNLHVYQDISNAQTKLSPAEPPDESLRNNQALSIEKGGTVENALAFQLDDPVTPVDVVATTRDQDVIGTTTFELSTS